MVVMVLQVSPSLPVAQRAPLISVGWTVPDGVQAAVVRRQPPFLWMLVRLRRQRQVGRLLNSLPQLQLHLF